MKPLIIIFIQKVPMHQILAVCFRKYPYTPITQERAFETLKGKGGLRNLHMKLNCSFLGVERCNTTNLMCGGR